ncbi:MAG: PEGA domain-containing protein [Myxococcota bacterium]
MSAYRRTDAKSRVASPHPQPHRILNHHRADVLLVAARKKRAKAPKRQVPRSQKIATKDDDSTKTLPPPPELPSTITAVAVLPLHGIDIDDELRDAIERALLREIDVTEGMQAVSPRDVLADLNSYDLKPYCNGNTRCVALAGRYARAQLALEARIAALGGTLSISMRLVDSQTGEERARVADPLSDIPSTRAQELHRLAVQLLTPELYVGTLQITSSDVGAEVYVDDKLVGSIPLNQPLTGLKAGPHILRMHKPGFSELYRFVDVIYNRSSTINIDLKNNTISGVIVEEVSHTGFGALYVVTDQEGIEIRIDGAPRGTTLLESAIDKVAAGKRKISFHREGSASLIEIVPIEAGKRANVLLSWDPESGLGLRVLPTSELSTPLPDLATIERPSITDSAATSQTVQLPKPRSRLVTGIVVAGVGAASLGAAGYLALQVQSKSHRGRDIVESVTSGTLRPTPELIEELSAINRQGPKLATAQWIALGTGVAFVGTGASLILWHILSEPQTEIQSGAPSDAPRMRASFTPLIGGGLLSLQRQW